MTVAKNIKRIRELYGATQGELANIAGVTENAVSKWENGYSTPRAKAAQAIADYFGLQKYNILENGGMDNIDPVSKKPLTNVYDEVGAYDGLEFGCAPDNCVPDYGFYCPRSVRLQHESAFFVFFDQETSGELPSSCMALIDPVFNTVEIGELYAVWKSCDGEAWDNWAAVERAYKPEFPNTWHVIGRVVWYSSCVPYITPSAKAGAKLTTREETLLGNYRRLSDRDKRILLNIAQLLQQGEQE